MTNPWPTINQMREFDMAVDQHAENQRLRQEMAEHYEHTSVVLAQLRRDRTMLAWFGGVGWAVAVVLGIVVAVIR